MDKTVEEMIQKIFKKNAILFVGAGFSCDAANCSHKIPMADELSYILCNFMGLENNNNLQRVSDYFLGEYIKNNPDAISKFCRLMKDTFTVTKADKYYDEIINIPWKRIYTTNYDNLVEFLGTRNQKNIYGYNLKMPFNSNENICLHINGRIDDLNESNYDSALKLSASSYLLPDGFKSSTWYSVLNSDIQTASAIVFIGYSLYDFNIEQILFEQPDLKNKVYFIQNIKLSEIDKYTYEKYGHLLMIEAKGFSDNIKQYKMCHKIEQEESFYVLEFQEYKINDQFNLRIRDSIKENFLLKGELDLNYYFKAFAECDSSLMVVRGELQNAINMIKKSKYLVIIGNMGNGKTVFLNQLMTKLFMNGEHVFYILNHAHLINCKSDIEKIAQQPYESILVIDSYLKYIEIVEYIIKNNFNNIKLIIADRTIDHIHSKLEIPKDLVSLIEIESLNDKELNEFYKIIDNLYLWDKKLIEYGYHYRIDHIKKQCNSEISLILTDILKSEQIKHKINEAINSVMESQNIKYHFFIICLLNVLDIPITVTILRNLIDSYDYKIFDNTTLKYFIQYDFYSQKVNTKSSIFSIFILSNIFETQFIIDECIALLIKLDKNLYAYDSILHTFLDIIRKNLFRFNFIERILPSTNKLNNLLQYYDTIKSKLPSVTNNPQYWLQYAMCFIAYNDKFEQGQRYLNKAYECAKGTRYDTHKIDNQQARLYLKIALHESDIKVSFDAFCKANTILQNHRNDIYKYKIIIDYKDYVDKKKSQLNEQELLSIKQMSISLKHSLENYIVENGYNSTTDKCYNILNTIINTE